MYTLITLQEFDFKVLDQKGYENQVADHLSLLDQHSSCNEDMDILYAFPDEVVVMATTSLPWYANFAYYVLCGIVPEGLKSYQRKNVLVDAKKYFWDEPYLFRELKCPTCTSKWAIIITSIYLKFVCDFKKI